MRDPFQELAAEHLVIAQMLGALDAAARKDVPRSLYEGLLECAARYVDGYHHAKEEERLFRYLHQRGTPRDYGPLEELSKAHTTGRTRIEAMRACLEAGDIASLRREALAYVAESREHLRQEDEVLFPMGRALLTPAEIEEIRLGFQHVPEPKPSAAYFVDQVVRLQAAVTAAP